MPAPSRTRTRPSLAPHAAALALLGLVACGGAGPSAGTPGVAAASAPASAAPSAAPTAVATAALAAKPAKQAPRALVRLRDVDGNDFPAPLIDVVVSGFPTSMLLDTGATHHIVAGWVTDEIGASKGAAASGVDHAGRTLAITRLEGTEVKVAGWGNIDTSNAFIAQLPAPLRAQGIGGILSPQSLVREDTRAVVIDFRKGTMTEGLLTEALGALESEPGAAFTGEVRACSTGSSLPYVRATIAGLEIDAQLDTGATGTTVRAGSPVGVLLKPKAQGKSSAIAASGAFTVPSVDSARVKVGALEADVSIDLVPRDARPGCTNDAFLGMDALRGCTLVLGTTTVAARCNPPAH